MSRENADGTGTPHRLFFFLAANMLFGAGLFAHAFLYNFYLEALGLGTGLMGVAAAALTAGGIIAILPAGLMVDRIGARTAYIIACVSGGTGLILGGLATSRGSLLAAAVVAGAGTATWRVSMGPLTMALAPGRIRSRIFSWNVALLVGSGAAWIASAGALPDLLQNRYALDRLAAIRIVLIAGGLLTACAAILIAFVAAPSKSPAPPARPARAARFPPRSPIAIAIAAVFAWMCASALIIPFFNIYFTRVHTMPVARVGFLFAIAQAGTALLLVLGGEAAARFGARRTLTFWCISFAPALVLLSFTTSTNAAIALFFLQGLVAPATNPLLDEILLASAPAERHGIVSSSRNAATELSGFAAAASGGFLLEQTSFPVLFLIAAAVAAVGAALLLLAIRRLPASTP